MEAAEVARILLTVTGTLIVGFIIAIIFKAMVNAGLHHTVHCIESMCLLIGIILFALGKCDWFIYMVLSTLLWRHVFRVIADCKDIATEFKEKQKALKK